MKDEKYIVFKRDAWDEWIKNFQAGGEPMALDTVPDAVVIRLQDIFAGPALHAYASSISTVMEIAQASDTPVSVFRPEQWERLNQIRDYFFQQALEADDIRTKKVPD
jgi:hypothetical protein